MDPYDTKISDILASKEFLLNHPASSQLGSDLYSSAVNSVSEILLRQRVSGQYTSAANSLAFGAQSSFFLQPGSIMGSLILTGSVILPRYTRAPDYWMLNAIDSVELIISGSSSVQSLRVSGKSMMDYVFSSLDSNKIEGLRAANPFLDLNAAGETVSASCPLHLFFSSADISSVFPLDTSTLQSQCIINIRWKQVVNCFSGDATNAVTLPAGWSTLYMKAVDQVVVNNDFALANELRMDKEMVYSLPLNYLQTYSQIINVAALGAPESSITLTSQPTGALLAILVSCTDTALEGSAGTQTIINPYGQFGSARLLYNGVELYNASSDQEMYLMNSIMYDKDNGLLKWRSHATTTAAAVVVGFESSPVLCIPMCNDISEVIRGRRHENVKNYSGSSLQFFFTISARGIPTITDTFPISSQLETAQNTGNYRLTFTFVTAGLLEINQQTVSLRL